MAQSLIDILIRARNEASGPIKEVNVSLTGLEKVAGLAKAGLAGLAAAAGISSISQLATAINGLAREAAGVERLQGSFETLTASIGQSADAVIDKMRKASQGAISDADLILQANRAITLGTAKSGDDLVKLLEIASARGRALGRSASESFQDIVLGISRLSLPILDNLGIIVDGEKVYGDYASTLGKTAEQLNKAEKQQALLNSVVAESQTLIAANKNAAGDLAGNFERMDASIQNAKVALGELFAPAVAVVAQNIADAAAAAATQVEAFGRSASAADAQGLSNVIGKLEEGLARLKTDLAAAREAGDFAAIADASAQVARQQDLLTQATDAYFAALREAFPAQQASADAMNRTSIEAEAQAAAMRRAAEAAGTATANYDPLNVATNSLVSETAALNDALAGTPGWLQAAARAAVAAGQSIAEATADVVRLKGELADLESAAGGARSAILREAAGVAGIVGDSRALQLAQEQLGRLDFRVAALTQRLKDGSISQTEYDYTLARLNDTVTETFGNIRQADADAQRLASQGLAAVSSAADDAQRAFDDLKGKVAGVLQGALDPGVGVDPADFLPRQDAINEDARRLADVAVNGFDSPWASYLSQKFPALFEQAFQGADIKEQAARALQDFQDGLTPQLIDKDTAKERVRRMLIGEQRLDELAREIAGELSDELGGVDVSQAQNLARRALGGDSGSGGLLAPPDSGEVSNQYGSIGATAAQAFAGGVRGAIVDADLGSTVTAALDEQLRADANLARLTEGGRVSGSAWGTGFLETVGESVPSRLIELLSQLVAPGVENLLNQRTTLEGAR